jgi:hypothetical protein
MANGNGFIITKDTWCNMPQEQREWLLFDTMQDMNVRIKAVEKRPLTDKCIAFLGGIVGGALAAFGIKFGGT